MRFVMIVGLCAACGRSSLPDLSPPTAVPTLGGVPLASSSWSTPQRLVDVEALLETVRTNVNTNMFDPVLSEDGLSLFVTTDIGGTWDVYELRRPSLTSSFDQIAPLGTDVNPTGVVTFGYQPLPSLGFVAAFGNYPLEGIAAGTFVVVFADAAESPFRWRASTVSLPFEVVIDPRLTADGNTMMFAVATIADPRRSLYVSERATTADEFSAAVPVEGLTQQDNSAPWLSADKRVLLFANADPNAETTSELWSASRIDVTGPFTDAAPIPELNSPDFDGEPYVFESAEVCELYIISWRPEAPGFRLYRSLLTAAE